MTGIVCNDSLEVVGHSLFRNFRLGLENYLSETFKDVGEVNDLEGVNLLIIVDEHFTPHLNIWKNSEFIDKLNRDNIKVLVFNFEKIFNSKFPWNEEHQKVLSTISNLVQIVSDISDAKILDTDIINKQYLSRDTELEYEIQEKQDRVLFIGQSEKIQNSSYAYYERYLLLNNISNIADFPLDIDITGRQYTYREYLTKLASYKYVLNPLGTGEFINLRYYEALKVGCIPIQQVTDDIILNYSELEYGHTFKTAEDISLPTKKFKVLDFYLEDYFKEINLKSLIL